MPEPPKLAVEAIVTPSPQARFPERRGSELRVWERFGSEPSP